MSICFIRGAKYSIVMFIDQTLYILSVHFKYQEIMCEIINYRIINYRKIDITIIMDNLIMKFRVSISTKCTIIRRRNIILSSAGSDFLISRSPIREAE